MVANIKESLKTMCKRETAKKNGLTEPNMLGAIKMARNTDMEFTSGLTEAYTREPG